MPAPRRVEGPTKAKPINPATRRDVDTCPGTAWSFPRGDFQAERTSPSRRPGVTRVAAPAVPSPSNPARAGQRARSGSALHHRRPRSYYSGRSEIARPPTTEARWRPGWCACRSAGRRASTIALLYRQPALIERQYCARYPDRPLNSWSNRTWLTGIVAWTRLPNSGLLMHQSQPASRKIWQSWAARIASATSSFSSSREDGGFSNRLVRSGSPRSSSRHLRFDTIRVGSDMMWGINMLSICSGFTIASVALNLSSVCRSWFRRARA